MYRKIEDFKQNWVSEMQMTQRILDALTDESMGQSVADGHRTIGRIAWHIVTTIPEMISNTGLALDKMLDPEKPVPATAAEIAAAYRAVSSVLLKQVEAEWTDDSLLQEDELYGEKWERRFTLMALVQHQVHHRGQLTVLMRQAGIKVPSLYGPAMEDWDQYGMQAPQV